MDSKTPKGRRIRHVNPYRIDKNDPSRGTSERIVRWLGLFALIGAAIFGLILGQSEKHEADTLLASPSATSETGTITDVSYPSSRGGTSSPKVTVVTESGQTFTDRVNRSWNGTLGDQVTITTHPETELWFMTHTEKDLSTQDSVRNGTTRVAVGLVILIACGFGFSMYRKIMARRWDQRNGDTLVPSE